MNYQLKSRQICLFIIAFFPIVKIFIMPSVLAEIANEDLWLCAVLSLLLDFITLIFIIKACKSTKTNFFGLIENCLGKVGAKIVFSFYLAYFLLKAIVPLNEQKDYVELTLYTLMPSKLYFLPFFAVAFYLCTKKLCTIGRCADVLWFFSVVGIIVLLALSIPNADYTAILPIGANGLKNISMGSYYSLNWFGDVVYLAFFIGEFKHTKKDTVKIILSFVIYALIVLAFLITFYSVFTSIAFRQRFALTEISKYTAVINNIGRFDYLGIVLLLFSNVFALTLPLYFSCRIIEYLFGITNKFVAPLIVIGLQALILICLTQFYASIENYIKIWGGIFFIIMGNVIPALTALMTKKESKYAKHI